jgi:hypothetical protein
MTTKLTITNKSGGQITTCVWDTEQQPLTNGVEIVIQNELYQIETITEIDKHYIRAVGKLIAFQPIIVGTDVDIKEGDTIVLKNGKQMVVTGFVYHLNAIFVKCGDYSCRPTNIEGVLLTTPEKVKDYNDKIEKIFKDYTEQS